MVSKIDLGCPVTPLEKLNSLSKYLGPQIYFKRDDLTGLGLGGNKVRKLKYLFWEASQLGTNVIISTASIQSNFLRILTAACKKMGWRCRLLVRGKRDTKLNGNYLTYKIMGAEIEYLDTTDPFSRKTLDLMEECRHEEI